MKYPIGTRYGWFTAIKESEKTGYTIAKCDCGRIQEIQNKAFAKNKYGCKNHIMPSTDIMKAELICWSRNINQIRNAHHIREFYFNILKPYGQWRYGHFRYKILQSLSYKHYCVKIWCKFVDEPELSNVPNFFPRCGRYTTSFYRVDTPETPDSLEKKARAFNALCKKNIAGDRRTWVSSGGVCHDGKSWIIFSRRMLRV